MTALASPSPETRRQETQQTEKQQANDRDLGPASLEARVVSFEERAKQIQQEIERIFRERTLSTRVSRIPGVEALNSRLPEASAAITSSDKGPSRDPHGQRETLRLQNGTRTNGRHTEGGSFLDEMRKELGPDPLSGGKSTGLVGTLRTEMKGVQRDMQAAVTGIQALGNLSLEEARVLSELQHSLAKLAELNKELDDSVPNDTKNSHRTVTQLGKALQ